ncbi:putative amidoligase domain-containing protein [Cohnella thailandensis]|uniref:PhiEco32-like amidoligase-type 2 protein n=1 Tax=Cohnella thailandensis TaxID=557557 RepID=A0A841T5T9_9BACL|nr:hypothetical protein [Cohnella thailandensis]MBP1977203.1 hypothetical protein [Cohnella thailandensis]
MAGRVWLLRDESGRLDTAAGIAGVMDGTPGPEESLRGDVLIRLGRGDLPSSLRLGQAAEAWIWNERAEHVASLGNEETARRLRREGFVTALPAGRPSEGRATASGTNTGRTFTNRTVIGRGTASWPSAAYERETRRDRDRAPRSSVLGGGFDPIGSSGFFRVCVFGLDTALVDPLPVDFRRPLELERRLARASARALYALGLDSGTVGWRVGRGGRLGAIVSLSPWIEERGEEWPELLRERLKRFADSWSREARQPVRVRLGADPEFVLLSPAGKVVPASRYLPKRGSAGCDAMRVGGTLRWPLAELRPEPAEEPRELATSIRRLLALAAGRTAGAAVRFRAGAAPVRGLPLGGHLHVSGAALTGERLRALDNAVALPLRLLEPPEANRRRPRYGSLGDYRSKSHGGFEYRTPPSWLVSPTLTRGTLALAKLASEHSRELAADRPLDDDRMRDAFYGGDRRSLLEGAERVYRLIRSTSSYSLYQEDIDPIFKAIRENRHWDETTDLRKKWRIPYAAGPD